MSTKWDVLERAAKQAAELAPGPWDNHESRASGSGYYVTVILDDDGKVVCEVGSSAAVVRSSTIERVEASISFLTAVDPATILALIDELRTLQAENERLKGEVKLDREVIYRQCEGGFLEGAELDTAVQEMIDRREVMDASE